jgi:hypothetical protein
MIGYAVSKYLLINIHYKHKNAPFRVRQAEGNIKSLNQFRFSLTQKFHASALQYFRLFTELAHICHTHVSIKHDRIRCIKRP